MKMQAAHTTHSSSPAQRPTAQIGVGQVRHERLRPASHAFTYPTYFLMLPLRTLATDPSAWCGLRRARWGLVTFRDQDHGDGRADALQWIDELLKGEGIHDAQGEVWLHCYPRVLGHAFKPVSFWYAHRTDGTLAAVLAEVNNTFGERHCYLLSGPQLRWGAELKADKVFHVSPFCAVQGDYRFRFLRTGHPPQSGGTNASERTVVRIEHHDANGPLILTSISGRLSPATTPHVIRVFFSMPMLTLGVVFRIHWQALKLAVKRVPFFRKPAPPQGFVTR